MHKNIISLRIKESSELILQRESCEFMHVIFAFYYILITKKVI